MAEIGFKEPEKAYLVYYDGPTGQVGLDHVCGQGARSGGFDLPGLAVVYLDSCDADQGDKLRPVVAMHELVHVFGAVGTGGTERLPERARLRLPARPDDRCADRRGARGARPRLGPQRLLRPQRQLDRRAGLAASSSGSTRPTARRRPLRSASVSATTSPASCASPGEPSTDDVGPVAYRIYEDGQFVREVTTTTVRLADTHDLALFAIRAADGVGRLSAPVDAPLPVRGRHGRRAGPADPRHGPAAGDHPRHDQADGEGRPCSAGRPHATPAASAPTGSRSGRGRSPCRSRRSRSRALGSAARSRSRRSTAPATSARRSSSPRGRVH